MKKVSASIRDEHMDLVEEREDQEGINSKSEALRSLLDEYQDLRTECDELRKESEELRTTTERLRNEKRLILQDREEKKELVRYVEDERTAEQRWRQAGLGTRLSGRRSLSTPVPIVTPE